MTLRDFSGLETTLTSEAARDAWDDTVLAVLSHGASAPDHLTRTLELAPDFALAHAAKGLFCMALARSEMVAVARECHASALKAAEPNARERMFVQALGLWLDGRMIACADRLDAVLLRWPRDAFAMKMVQSVRFMLGDGIGMRRSLETIRPAYGEDHPAHGYYLGCLSFALEEAGEYAAAIHHGTRAVDHTPTDAWGLHAVTHVHDMMANPADGLAWLDRHADAITHCNNFGGHVWWHRALMHLETGETERVLDLYDREIRAAHTDDFRDIANASSLLARLALEGIEVGDRWDELAEIGEARAEDDTYVFAGLHTMLSLIGGNRRQARGRLLASMRSNAGGKHHAAIKRDPGTAMAEGLEAFAEGDHVAAHRNLFAGRGALPAIGGSHAQRDVFLRVGIDAAIRAGALDDATLLIAERRTQRGGHDDAFATVRRQTIADASTGELRRAGQSAA